VIRGEAGIYGFNELRGSEIRIPQLVLGFSKVESGGQGVMLPPVVTRTLNRTSLTSVSMIAATVLVSRKEHASQFNLGNYRLIALKRLF
jgi:hypothetical protein